MKLILHIGSEKTGTTAIQRFFKKNRERLIQNGIYYPLAPMVPDGNHRWGPLFANNNDYIDDFVVMMQLQSTEEKRKLFLSAKANSLVSVARLHN